MNVLKNWIGTTLIFLLGCSAIPFTMGCSRSLPRGAVGNLGLYNYSPSVIQTGDTRQIWWCSQGVNPSNSSQNTDAIYFESINLSTHESFGPVQVLSETPDAWDSAFTCNPKVIGGVFEGPLGDGQTYSFAMYYVATAQGDGTNNRIGVAFSNDGILWKKYPQPVIQSTSQTGYGVGQPALYNADHKSAITMFYEDNYPTVHYVAAVSTDGLHFKVHGTLTSNGLDQDDPEASWGDMTFDVKAGEWYAVFNRPTRPPSATGGVLERGQYGIELYKIPQDALLTGTSPWRQLVTLDTNTTGFESNFLAAFVRDFYGNIDLTSVPTSRCTCPSPIRRRTGMRLRPRQEIRRSFKLGSSYPWSGCRTPAQPPPCTGISMGTFMKLLPAGLARMEVFNYRNFSAIFMRIHCKARRCLSTAASERKRTTLYRLISVAKVSGFSASKVMDTRSRFRDSNW